MLLLLLLFLFVLISDSPEERGGVFSDIKDVGHYARPVCQMHLSL